MIVDVGLLVGGLLVLALGGEFLVKGSVVVAKALLISPLVIGMTIVSFGTSAPELLVSLQSALNGSPGIAIGNVVGSNIANIALVLGLTVIIFPVVPGRQMKRVDWPMLVLATLLFIVFALDGQIQTWEGILLFVCLVIFTVVLVVKSRRDSGLSKREDNQETGKSAVWVASIYILIGFVALYFGAEWLIKGAVNIAKSLEMEEHVIGLTIVAFGTSAPELVTSAVAAYRKQTDISLGNLVGSNIFNIMAVIGITAMAHPIAVKESVLYFDFWWMLGIAIGLGVMLFVGSRIGRIKGFVLFLTYLVYIALLIFREGPLV